VPRHRASRRLRVASIFLLAPRLWPKPHGCCCRASWHSRFVTGGLAYSEFTTSNAVAGTNITGAQGTNNFTLTPVAGSASSTTTRVGWTIGAGIEGVVSGNWTAKLEYLYVDLGDVSGAFVTAVAGLSGGVLTSRYSSHVTDNILRVGLNYRWAAR
jgi:outer membrane immunogenic protein